MPLLGVPVCSTKPSADCRETLYKSNNLKSIYYLSMKMGGEFLFNCRDQKSTLSRQGSRLPPGSESTVRAS
jgi:hypothetical protein